MGRVISTTPAVSKTRKRGRPPRAVNYLNNLVKTKSAKTHYQDRLTLWSVKTSGLLGNPFNGRGPVLVSDTYSPRDRKPYLFTKRFAPWERTGPLLKAVYLNTALATANDGTKAHAITLLLSSTQIKKAMTAQRGPLDYLRREIIRRLGVALRRIPDMWLAVEAFLPGGEDLHLHGAIGLFQHEEKIARSVLKGFSKFGVGTKARGRALYVRKPNANNPSEENLSDHFLTSDPQGILPMIDDPRGYPGPAIDADDFYDRHQRTPHGWGQYSLKDAVRVAQITKKTPLTENSELRKRAIELYEHHRRILKQIAN